MSKFISLNGFDVIKGFIVAIISGGLTVVYQLLSTGQMLTEAQFTMVGMSALASGIAYILKNVLTNSKGELLTPETNA